MVYESGASANNVITNFFKEFHLNCQDKEVTLCLYQSKVEEYSKPHEAKALIGLQFQPRQETLSVLMYKVQLQGRSWIETKRLYLKTTFVCDKAKKSIRCNRDRKRALLDFSVEMKFNLEKNFLIKTCCVKFQIKERTKFLRKSKCLHSLSMPIGVMPP